MKKNLSYKFHVFIFSFAIYSYTIDGCTAMKFSEQVRELENQLEQHEQTTGHRVRRDPNIASSFNLSLAGNLSRGENCKICEDYLAQIEKRRRMQLIDTFGENKTR